MKKIFFVLSAVALLGLASCVDKIDDSKLNPTFDPDANTVKTAFTFNVATEAKTKSTRDIVQDGQSFRGMTDMTLMVFNATPATGVAA